MIVHEGPSPVDGSPIVGILTGVTSPSANRKTGRMAQLWILPADATPLDAMRTGADAAICGSCPLRGTIGTDGKRRVGRACYVNSTQPCLRVYHEVSLPRGMEQ